MSSSKAELELRWQRLSEDLASYKGDDPLSLPIEVLKWGQQNCDFTDASHIFESILEEIVRKFWLRYRNDRRFVNVAISLADMKEDPAHYYELYHKKRIGSRSGKMYRAWAEALYRQGDYKGADSVYQLALSMPVSHREDLTKLYSSFLMEVGKKCLTSSHIEPLDSIINSHNESESVQCWLMNPCNIDEIHKFDWPTAYFDEDSPSKIPMYPKSKVYPGDGTECSLEELKAAAFFKKEENRLKEHRGEISGQDSNPQPVPLLGEDSVHHQSVTAQTKIALNLVDAMWTSLGPEASCTAASATQSYKTVETASKSRLPFEIVSDENEPPQSHRELFLRDGADKPGTLPENPKIELKTTSRLPFNICTEENLGHGYVEAPISQDKSGLQPNLLTNTNMSNAASEPPASKLPFTICREEDEPNVRPESSTVLRRGVTNDGLLHGPESVQARHPCATSLDIVPLLSAEPAVAPTDDTTCNTKAFAFALPSSTPVTNRKSVAAYIHKINAPQLDSTEEVVATTNPHSTTKPELSVILEASKERCSSSGSSQETNFYSDGSEMRARTFSKQPNPRDGTITSRKVEPPENSGIRPVPDLTIDTDAALVRQLSAATVSEPPCPDPIPLLPPTCMVAEDEMTCNTKAFAFVLPSSTPLSSRKSTASSAPKISAPRFSATPESAPSCTTKPELSVIMEASKERCSSSGSTLSDSSLKGDIDPFSPILIDKLLIGAKFPQPHCSHGYHVYTTHLPALTTQVKLATGEYLCKGNIGQGAYAKVVKAVKEDCTFAFKVEKPPCKWEYYIAKEIRRRVQQEFICHFLDIGEAHIFNNGSILVTEFAPYGTLLDLTNLYKITYSTALDSAAAVHIVLEMIKIVFYLHEAKIIHGDIKPDNFVLRSLPAIGCPNSLQLIDFGRSIDMSFFPDGQQFTRVVTTDGFQCNEMKEGKPWSYQHDLYGLVASIYVVLVGDYMKTMKRNNKWTLSNPLPRGVRNQFDPIFSLLLNCSSPHQDLIGVLDQVQAIDNENSSRKRCGLQRIATMYANKKR